MSDLVSVIIPFYKKKKYFEKCIKSIVSQTYKNIEVIIIYDDENKNDLNHIKLLIKKYKNFRIYINKKLLELENLEILELKNLLA